MPRNHTQYARRDLAVNVTYKSPMVTVYFPFLVLKVKSETGDTFDDIKIQTEFAL